MKILCIPFFFLAVLVIREVSGKGLDADSTPIHNLIAKGRTLLGKDDAAAQHYLREAVRWADSIQFQDNLVTYAMLEISSDNVYKGKLDSAIRLSLRALKFYTEQGDVKEMARTRIRIGDILRANGLYSKGYEYFYQAIREAGQRGDSSLLCMGYNRLAACFYEDLEMSLDSSEKYALISLDIAKKIKQPRRVFNNLNILGSIESKKNNYAKALKLYEEALPILMVESPNEQALILANMARNYHLLGNLKKAEEVSLKALEMAQKYQIPQYIFMACMNLDAIYKDMGDYRKAHHYLEMYCRIESGLINQRVLVQLQDFDYHMEMEKKINENKRLEYEQRIISNRYRLTLVLALMLFIILVLAGWFVAYQQRQRKRIRIINEKLNESNMVLRRFISILAHDLRSPFNSILGFVQILKEDENQFQPEHRIAINSLYSSGHSTHRLLERLLEWSRLQSGSISMDKKEISLNKLAEETISLLKPAADLKSIRLTLQPANPINLMADQEMLLTIIRNLISNAIKFTRPGGEVEVTLNQTPAGTRIIIKDNGVGMDDKTIARLFRLDDNFKSKGTAGETGTGLGLILCKEYTEMHGGNIFLESQPLIGTTFTVELPV